MKTPREFEKEQHAVALAMVGALATSMAVLAIVATTDRGAVSMAFPMRLQFAVRAELVVIAWLAAAIANVARLRFGSRQDIDGSNAAAESEKVRVARAILQNTLEQAALAGFAHLVVAASFDRCTGLVTALVCLFAIGRLLFWLGYRQGAAGRAFGFALTFYPSVLALLGSAAAILLGWAG